MVQPADHTSVKYDEQQINKQGKWLADCDVVVLGAKEELGRAEEAGADVRDVGCARFQLLHAAEVADLDDAQFSVDENVVGLDVTVADVHGVDEGQAAEDLERNELQDGG